jgi:hypothetical protein
MTARCPVRSAARGVVNRRIPWVCAIEWAGLAVLTAWPWWHWEPLALRVFLAALYGWSAVAAVVGPLALKRKDSVLTAAATGSSPALRLQPCPPEPEAEP